MIVRVDPSFDPLYTFYYLEGAAMLPGVRIIYDSKPFSAFKHTKDYVAILLESPGKDAKKVVIDFGDTKTFRKLLYDWADVYAKVNLTPEDFSTHPKMMPIGPASLGIRRMAKWKILLTALKHYLAARKRIPAAADFFASYKASLRRLTFEGYRHAQPSTPDYVHFVSTLWKDDKVANDYRVNFMEAVHRAGGFKFEGGFAPRADGQHLGYDRYMGPAFESLENYRQKIGKSFVVFNTPAVKQSHGWKLPEFMAWGKAIISTPPVRMFPEPLVDGVHWLITDGSVDDIEAKIRMLQANPELHAQLEINARAYFDKYLRPDIVMRRIIERAGYKI
jgi:glycosyltransferase involved in cell wall biosynthesis